MASDGEMAGLINGEDVTSSRRKVPALAVVIGVLVVASVVVLGSPSLRVRS
jgi:hypothetical protein